MEDRIVNVTISSFYNEVENIPDCVVWNAWVLNYLIIQLQINKCHNIGDMEDEDYKRYVCVEPGCVRDYKRVEPKHTLSLKQEMNVREL